MFLLLLFVGFVTFANGLRNPMMIDDHAFFDEKMRNIRFLPIQFIPDKDKYLGIKEMQTDAYYRPLAHVIPMLAYQAFKRDVVGHHLLNMFLMVMAACMLAYFIVKVFNEWRLALLVSIMYLIHPINGVMVNYITANVFSAQVFFMLSSLLTLRANRIVFSSVFFILALFCHETAMALPFYAIILFLIKPAHPREVRRSLILWGVGFAYFIFRMKFASLGDSVLGNFSKYDMNIVEYLASLSHLIFWYISKLFIPFGIVLIKAMPVERGISAILWFAAGSGLAAALGVLVWFNRQKPRALLGLIWFIVGFLPLSQACLFRPSHGLMIEPHWFLFPVIGFFLWVGSVFLEHWQNKRIRILIGLLFIAWFGLSLRMNTIWGDEVGYCQYWLKQSPEFTSPMSYLAKAYETKKDYTNARYWYEQALNRNYKPEMQLVNLGYLDIIEHRWDDAKRNLHKALELNPRTAVAYANLGAVYYVESNYEEAKRYFMKGISLDPFAILPRLNLAKVLIKQGDVKGAIRAYQGILHIVPDDELTKINLLKLYWEAKKYDMAAILSKDIMDNSRNRVSVDNARLVYEASTRMLRGRH